MSATDTFTGTDGDTWSDLWSIDASTGGTATLHGGAGRLTTSSNGGYADYTAAVLDDALVGNDFDFMFTIEFETTSEHYNRIYFCSSQSRADGYLLELANFGGVFLNRSDGYSFTQLGSVSLNPTVGTRRRIRVRRIGTTGDIKVRVWDPSGAEPSTWNIEVTDSTYTGTTFDRLQFYVLGGGAAASRSVLYDDFEVSAYAPAVDVPEAVTYAVHDRGHTGTCVEHATATIRDRAHTYTGRER